MPGVRAFCESRGEDVWLRESGTMMVSAAPAQDAAVDRAVAAAAEVGAPEQAVPLDVRWSRRRECVRRSSVAASISLTARRCSRRGSYTHYVGAAMDAGVDLYEHTPALRIRAGYVATPGGTVRAPEIVVAVNAAATGWRPVARHVTNFGSYVVLTEPVPELLERDRLDGRRGDLRRAHVPALLPHDCRRARAHG